MSLHLTGLKKITRQEVINKYNKHADLSLLNLDGLDLSKIDLTGANLTSCSFRDTNLAGARLNHADLRGSLFQNSNLVGANFNKAILSHAAFVKSDMQMVDLSKSLYDSSTFIDDYGLRKVIVSPWYRFINKISNPTTALYPVVISLSLIVLYGIGSLFGII